MARLTKEDLRSLPIFLLEKLRDTAATELWDAIQLRNSVVERLEEPQIMFTEPELIHERDRLKERVQQLSDWHADVAKVIREPRTLFQRVAVDDPLNPDAPSV